MASSVYSTTRTSRFLQELHGMFDQVDHAKVLRNDTQVPADIPSAGEFP